MRVGLYINEECRSGGPYKVYTNLYAGLRELGHEVLVNQNGDLTGCLHDCPQAMKLPPSTLMGPNLFIMPSDRPEFFKRYGNFIVPSNWVRDAYKSCEIASLSSIRVWPVGIDTTWFDPPKVPKYDCLLYYKNRSQEELTAVRAMLSSMGQTSVQIEYGSYTEAEFISLLSKCQYAVLLTNTESQGIAYMEILSSNLPCFVLDQKDWRGHPATSVPYFDARCGKISTVGNDTGDLLDDFGQFLEKRPEYKPRDYIMESHTLAHGAKKYMQMLEEIG